MVVALAAYGIMVVVAFFSERDMLYYPTYTQAPVAGTGIELVRGGVTLRGWVVNPGQDAAAVYFGGNAESVEYNRDLFEECCPGTTVYLVAYRGYGASEGEPRSSDILPDALAWYDRVARDHERVSVIGRSLGSGVAAYVAGHRSVSRAVLITPFDRMRDVAQMHFPYLPVRFLMRENYDTVDWLKGTRVPLLVIRAQRDDVIPPIRTDRLIADLPEGTPAVTCRGDHSSLGLDPAYRRAIGEFLAG